MATTISIPENYGYTVLIALGLIPFLSNIQGNVVTFSRKGAGVPYPYPYATPQQVKENPKAHRFNCAQRAHANLLENSPTIIPSLLFSGLLYPTLTPILGLVWVLGRIVYAYGYITSDKPNGKGRLIGGWFWLAQFWLLGLCFYGGWGMVAGKK